MTTIKRFRRFRQATPVCLAVLLLTGTLQADDLVEIQTRGPGDGDDFVTWTAAPCQIRVKPGSGLTDNLVVVLTNDAPHPIPPGRSTPLDGDLVFADAVAPGATAKAETLQLTLPKDGTWVPFVVAGKYGRPSERARDAVIEAHRDTAEGALVGSHGVMVRIRKWASTLTPYERDQLLEAMATVKASPRYQTFLSMHRLAVIGSPTNQAHQNAGFLAWHRAFLLHFERTLQETHPHVALHYWKQEIPSVPPLGDPPGSVAVFSKHFMGVDGTGASSAVVFAPDNDLFGWQINGQALPRDHQDRAHPDYISNPESYLVTLPTYRDLANPSSSNSFSWQLESDPHNNGHGWVGGWMAFCQRSPQDPIFWVFHCDIDRLWARWQYTQGRYDFTGADGASYLPNDAYATGSDVPLGHHLKDTMWPWDNKTGPVTPPDPFAERPAQAPNAPFPASPIPGFWPATAAAPRPADMVDYLGVNASGIDLGYSYDDTPFGRVANAVVSPSNLAEAREHMNILVDSEATLERRAAAARRLRRLPLEANHLDQLAAIVQKPEEPANLRRSALDRLGRSDPDRALSSALDILSGKLEAAVPLKVKAAERAGMLGMFTAAGRAHQADVRRVLFSVVTDKESPEVRAEALRWLAAFGDSNTIDLLRDTLGQKEEGLVSRIDALRLLGVAAPGASGNAIRPYLKHADPVLRTAALQSLGNDVESQPARRAILRDDSQPIALRAAALRSLMHNDETFPQLATTLLADNTEDEGLRVQAAAGVREYARSRVAQLGEKGLRQLSDQLTQACANGPESLRQTVDRIAEKIVHMKTSSDGGAR